VSGRIIDADVDAIANIARLTGQIEELKRERDAARICFEIESGDRRKSDAQRDELQLMLTACEEQRDAAKADKIRALDMKYAMHDRVRALEEALRTAKLNMKPNAIWALDKVDAALAPSPPAESPAPTGGYWEGFAEAARQDAAILDDARAQLAAANERIAVNEKLLATRDELLAMFDCPAHGACVPHAKEEVTRLRAEVAATKAQLGRAVAALRSLHNKLDYHAPKYSGDLGSGLRAMRDAVDAILADADSKDAGDAWRTFMAAARELRDHEATTCITQPACGNCIACRFNAALDAVDARRGGAK
jgi:hypothetical protein